MRPVEFMECLARVLLVCRLGVERMLLDRLAIAQCAPDETANRSKSQHDDSFVAADCEMRRDCCVPDSAARGILVG